MNLRSFFCSLAVTGTLAASALAHCQIPCGIYDDAARFKALAEHITTIEKSITEITALSGKDKLTPTEQNQLVRWVSNKESHAKAEAASAVHLKLLHQMLVGAMKCKQNADAATTASLKTALDAFEKAYNAK
ncbi:MAG: superoxide dismutase [Ni] [Verrucomicrobiales bacterium]